MSRPKRKDYKSMNILMDVQIRNQLERYSKKTGRNMTDSIETILSEYFKEYFKEDSENALR